MGTARTKANNMWNMKAYDRINLTVPKGSKENIKVHADTHDNGSVNAFINRAIEQQMQRDESEATA